MGREKILELGDEHPMITSGDVEVEEFDPRPDEKSYWERVDDFEQPAFGTTTSVLPDPDGRSPYVLKRILVENKRALVGPLCETEFFESEEHGAKRGDRLDISYTLRFDTPFGEYEHLAACSPKVETAFEQIVEKCRSEGYMEHVYFFIDKILCDHPDSNRVYDRIDRGADQTPTDRELVEMYAEEHAPVPEPTPKDLRSFAENNYSNEGSESSDNSPPEEHIVDIQQDASDIDDDADFETKMYEVANQTEDNDHIAEVIEYNPDMDDESVAITLRLPDQSIGSLEYDIPDTESTDDSSFVAMIDAARATRLHKPEESDGFVETKQPIELESIERLKNGEIPVKEHKDSWTVDTNTSLPIDIDDSVVDEYSSDSFRIDIDRLQRAFVWFGKGTFWAYCFPALCFLYPCNPVGTLEEFMREVVHSGWRTTTALILSTLSWILLIVGLLGT